MLNPLLGCRYFIISQELYIGFNDITILIFIKIDAPRFAYGEITVMFNRSRELEQTATIKDYLTVQLVGEREVNRNIKHYNLNAIRGLHNV